MSVAFSQLESKGDSIVVEFEDLDSGSRTRKELRREVKATDEEPLSEVTIVDFPED